MSSRCHQIQLFSRVEDLNPFESFKLKSSGSLKLSVLLKILQLVGCKACRCYPLDGLPISPDMMRKFSGRSQWPRGTKRDLFLDFFKSSNAFGFLSIVFASLIQWRSLELQVELQELAGCPVASTGFRTYLGKISLRLLGTLTSSSCSFISGPRLHWSASLIISSEFRAKSRLWCAILFLALSPDYCQEAFNNAELRRSEAPIKKVSGRRMRENGKVWERTRENERGSHCARHAIKRRQLNGGDLSPGS